MKILFLVVLIAAVAAAGAAQKSYENYKVYSVTAETNEHEEKLSRWQSIDGIDFWDGLHNRGAVRVMVSPEQQRSFEQFLTKNFIASKLNIENVEQTITHEKRSNELMRQFKTADYDFNHYWTLEEIYDFMEDLSSRFPRTFKTVDLAKTAEGRSLKAITVAGNGTVGKSPVVLIDAGIHAREWVAVMSAVYLLHQLSENRELLKVDWVIVPVANPDGYVYSHKTDRFWRKNRSPQAGGCRGVDLNRNFGLEWHAAPGSECQLTFPGTSAFSEPESRAVRDLVTKYNSSLHTYLAVHTYGNYVLYPYGYDRKHLVENWKEHHAVGEDFAKAVKQYSGVSYEVGNSAVALYPAYGASDDYVASQGARLSFTLELTGGGNLGFDLPPSQLKTVVEETFAGFKVLANNAAKSKR